MLRFFRKMGSMEQIFPIFNEYKIEGWGPMVGCSKIPGLSELPLEKIQSMVNQMHAKYQSFQCQFLTVPDTTQYDDIYIGLPPTKVIQLPSGTDPNKMVLREMNHRFLLLNDLNLTTEKLKNGNYNINKIPTLYRVFLWDNYLLFNWNHAIIDGISNGFVMFDVLSLLNNDKFDTRMVPYKSIEECIDPKYAKSSISRTIENWMPTSWALKFGRFYVSNSFLKKYNPLGLHRDDMLRFQYYFSDEFLTFPLKPFDKRDYRVDAKTFRLSKSVSRSIKKICKLKKVHMSSLFQYLITASMIECHSELNDKNYYKTIVNNIFSTIPMYKKPKLKVYLGIHASNYNTVIEYFRNMKIGSDGFWNVIAKIDEQVLSDDMAAKVFKNKFPFMNLKKFMKDILDSKSDIFNGRSFGAPTVSNPGIFNINKPYWKYKSIDGIGGANPGVGMGASYILAGTMTKGIDEMQLFLMYGKQFFTDDMAQKIMDTMKEKLEIIGSAKTNYKSKL